VVCVKHSDSCLHVIVNEFGDIDLGACVWCKARSVCCSTVQRRGRGGASKAKAKDAEEPKDKRKVSEVESEESEVESEESEVESEESEVESEESEVEPLAKKVKSSNSIIEHSEEEWEECCDVCPRYQYVIHSTSEYTRYLSTLYPVAVRA
jgi:superfamily II DNA helicase RecQ